MVKGSIIAELLRRHHCAPDNKTIAQNIVQFMAREGRSEQLLEPLLDREAWNASTESAKLCAALEVDRRLQVEHGGRWRLEGLRDWSCGEEEECPDCEGFGVQSYGMGNEIERLRDCPNCEAMGHTGEKVSHHLALFTHLPTGAEFSLVPGIDGVYEELDYRINPRGNIEHDNHTHQMYRVEMWKDGKVIRSSIAPSLSAVEFRLEREEDARGVKLRRWVKDGMAPFLVSRWPVTESQIVNASVGPKGFLGADEEYYIGEPQTGWSWDEVSDWCNSQSLSLPTPDQWEYACRAGSQTRFFWGDDFDESYVWYAGNSGRHGMNACLKGPYSPTMSCCANEPEAKSPKEHDDAGKWNAFGLVDCIGNIAEMTDKPYRQMGGSFACSQQQIEAIQYSIVTPSEQLGFRPVVAVPGLE